MPSTDLEQQLLATAAVRLANHPGALLALTRQIRTKSLPSSSLGLLSLDALEIRWSAVPGYAENKLVAFIDDWFDKANCVEPLPAGLPPPPEKLPDDPADWTPKQRRDRHDIGKERQCRRLILENWEIVAMRYGPGADGRQVLTVLKQKSEPGDKLPTLKTVQNRLIDLRREKLIP